MPIFRADRAAAVHSDVEDEMTATERETVSYEEGYTDGFDRGEEAVMQQIEGIIDYRYESAEGKLERLREFAEQFWKERES